MTHTVDPLNTAVLGAAEKNQQGRDGGKGSQIYPKKNIRDFKISGGVAIGQRRGGFSIGDDCIYIHTLKTALVEDW